MMTLAAVWEKWIYGKKISKQKHPNSPPCHLVQLIIDLFVLCPAY